MLKLKEIAPYLAYNLKVISIEATHDGIKETVDEIESVSEECVTFKKGCDWYFNSDENESSFNPILRNLSDLTKEIEVNGEKLIPGEYLSELIDENNMGYNDYYFDYKKNEYIIDDPLSEPYFIVSQLLEWHFDLFGLIERGDAIDINTLKL